MGVTEFVSIRFLLGTGEYGTTDEDNEEDDPDDDNNY